MAYFRSVLACVGVCMLVGCSDDGESHQGAEGGRCFADGTCNVGLTCSPANACIRGTGQDGSQSAQDSGAAPDQDTVDADMTCVADTYFCRDNTPWLCGSDGKTSTVQGEDCSKQDFSSFKFSCTPCSPYKISHCKADKPNLTVVTTGLNPQSSKVTQGACEWLSPWTASAFFHKETSGHLRFIAKIEAQGGVEYYSVRIAMSTIASGKSTALYASPSTALVFARTPTETLMMYMYNPPSLGFLRLTWAGEKKGAAFTLEISGHLRSATQKWRPFSIMMTGQLTQ